MSIIADEIAKIGDFLLAIIAMKKKSSGRDQVQKRFVST